ncbi:MAG: hypothetical protein CL878_15430 [Dehalococcoidia bacterium]|nr:hypothetical protein [Dehalococcoidia bacterium]
MTTPSRESAYHIIQQACQLLLAHSGVAELRAPSTRRGTVSGYFNDPEKMAHTAVQLSGKAPAIYATVNPVNPALLARAANRTVRYAKHTTTDGDIIRRCWLLLDLDPKRPAGISATEKEHGAALALAWQVRDWLCNDCGWPHCTVADSGNGAHLLVPIDLPNDGQSTTLIRRCLEAVDLRFTNDQVQVDLTTHSAAQLCKVYGTLAAKGDSTDDRPHRVAKLLDVPEQLGIVPRAELEQLAAMAPEQTTAEAGPATSGRRDFDLDEWIAQHGLPVVSSGLWQDGRKWVLNPCPWNADHTNRAAYIVEFANGAIAAGCHHNGCADMDWPALRDLYEPDWRERVNGSVAPSTTAVRGQGRNAGVIRWPSPPGDAAFAGLAGRVVAAVDPHTEADRMGVLAHLLAAFGGAVGLRPHAMVGATGHPIRNNFVIVGRTAKARKGESAAPIMDLFGRADPVWAEGRVANGLSTGEGLIWQVRDPVEGRERINDKGEPVRYETVITDPGVDDKRLLVLEPEFARVLKVMSRQGNTLSPVIRSAWDTGDLRIMTKTNAATATGAHITIVGHITIEELRRELTDTEAVNGFANRFWWFLVRRSKELPEPQPFEGQEVARLATDIADALHYAQQVDFVERDEEARALWHDVYSSLSAERDGLVGAILARAEAHVLRLSMVYALLDRSDVVRVEHLQSAIELWAYSERCVEYIFGDATGDPAADTIHQVLKANGELTRTQISNLLGRHESSARINHALQELLRGGRAHMLQRETNGRPAEVWRPA